MTNLCLSDVDLRELLRVYDNAPGAYAFGRQVADCLRELQERRVEVEKYKAWAASCDPAPVEPAAPQLPIGQHAYRQGEPYWTFHQGCQCQSCLAEYGRIETAQRAALNRNGDV